MKRVILLTDFSSTSRHAIEFAINMFGYEEVDYLLLNVYTEAHLSNDMLVSIEDLLIKESQRELQEEWTYFNDRFPDKSIKITPLSKYGELADVANRLRKSDNIDFVVMGTKGISRLEKTLLGSKTTSVVKKVKCPVMVIPEESKIEHPSTIAFATDYEELMYKDVLKPLIDLVQESQSKLRVVNIQNEEELLNIEQATEGVLLDHALVNTPHLFYSIQNKNTVEGLNQFVDENNIDLLVMVARKHSFFEQLFHTSVTKKMSMLSNLPMLFLHE